MDWVLTNHNVLSVCGYGHTAIPGSSITLHWALKGSVEALQFTQYTEYIDHEGKKEYGVFVRCYGGDVEKLNCRGVYRIPAPPDDSEVGLRIDF